MFEEKQRIQFYYFRIFDRCFSQTVLRRFQWLWTSDHRFFSLSPNVTHCNMRCSFFFYRCEILNQWAMWAINLNLYDKSNDQWFMVYGRLIRTSLAFLFLFIRMNGYVFSDMIFASDNDWYHILFVERKLIAKAKNFVL